MKPVAILILAAGASSRMKGRDKLLEKIDGTPLLARSVNTALATGYPVWMALPTLEHARAKHIRTATPVPVPDAQEGMGHSLSTGIAAIPPDHAILVFPADMPDISDADILNIINAYNSNLNPTLQQATSHVTPGHPVLFPPDCRAALLTLTGDQGAKHIVQANQHRLNHVPLPGKNAVTDLDTPEAWDAYLANRAAKS